MPCPRYSALLLLFGAALLLPAAARGDSCDQLWRARNNIFADAGHCFTTSRAIAVFGRLCHPPYGRLTAAQQARVDSITAEESRLGCSGGSGPPSSGDGAQLPPANQGGYTNDMRMNEAASVWTATKDTSSPAVLEAFISRFGDTPFGDLARARLDEVKKASSAIAPPTPPKERSTAPADTDMCPKYLPSVGRTVQTPCDP
jgi:hypothetical protein